MAGGIVPKKEALGVDICGVNDDYYIVRSDLNYYMKSTNFKEGTDLTVHSLHISCRGGDHYLAHDDDMFYIIKGTSYRRVSNLNTCSDGVVVYSLHPNCQGGDHYLAALGNFYVIFQEKGTYRRVSNMHSDDDAVEDTLHPEFKNGLYYWGVKGFYYFMKPCDESGINYYRCKDLHLSDDADSYSFHPDVLNFLPGGLSITKGPAYGTWECIKTISYDSESPFVSEKVSRKVGYTHQMMSSIEDKWNVLMSAPYNSGDLTAALVKMQFSLSSSYGGKSVNTKDETWSEATEVEESVNVTLKQPDETMCIWQYKLGLGEEDVLFCRDMKFDPSSSPPTEIPLPPA